MPLWELPIYRRERLNVPLFASSFFYGRARGRSARFMGEFSAWLSRSGVGPRNTQGQGNARKGRQRAGDRCPRKRPFGRKPNNALHGAVNRGETKKGRREEEETEDERRRSLVRIDGIFDIASRTNTYRQYLSKTYDLDLDTSRSHYNPRLADSHL